MCDLVDIKGHPRVDNIDGFAFVRGHQLVGRGIFPLTSMFFFTGGLNDSTGTSGDQDDDSLDQGLGHFPDGYAPLASGGDLRV